MWNTIPLKYVDYALEQNNTYFNKITSNIGCQYLYWCGGLGGKKGMVIKENKTKKKKTDINLLSI